MPRPAIFTRMGWVSVILIHNRHDARNAALGYIYSHGPVALWNKADSKADRNLDFPAQKCWRVLPTEMEFCTAPENEQ